MNLEFITQHYILIVMAACLAAGYIMKKSLDFIPNKYIPLILATMGAILGCIADKEVSMESIVYGAITGLASTGLHQTFTRIIEGEYSEGDLKESKRDGGKQNGQL